MQAPSLLCGIDDAGSRALNHVRLLLLFDYPNLHIKHNCRCEQGVRAALEKCLSDNRFVRLYMHLCIHKHTSPHQTPIHLTSSLQPQAYLVLWYTLIQTTFLFTLSHTRISTATFDVQKQQRSTSTPSSKGIATRSPLSYDTPTVCVHACMHHCPSLTTSLGLQFDSNGVCLTFLITHPPRPPVLSSLFLLPTHSYASAFPGIRRHGRRCPSGGECGHIKPRAS